MVEKRQHSASPLPKPTRDSASPRAYSEDAVRENFAKRRKRNDQISSDDDLDSHINVLAWLYSEDRAYGVFPDPMVYEARDLRMSITEDMLGLAVRMIPDEEIQSVLVGHGLKDNRISWQMRASTALGSGMFPSCVLSVSPADPSTGQYNKSQLEDAAKAIYEFISHREEGKGLKFLVEVQDTKRLTDHYAYNISSQHAHRVDVDAIWDRISEIATRELGEQLHSIGLFDMDRTDSTVRAQDPAQRRADFLPTFAVNVYNDGLHNFDKIVSELRSVLQSYPGNPFQVRLLHTSVGVARSGGSATSAPQGPGTTTLKMGSSIAPVGTTWCSTLGGFLILEKGDETKKVFMTAAHVIVGGEIPALRQGIPFASSDGEPEVRYPAPVDLDLRIAAVEAYKRTSLRQKKVLDDLKEMMEEEVDVETQEKIDSVENAIQGYDATIAAIEASKRDPAAVIGKTLISAPVEIRNFDPTEIEKKTQQKSHQGKTRMDWALVEVEGTGAEAWGPNKLPPWPSIEKATPQEQERAKHAAATRLNTNEASTMEQGGAYVIGSRISSIAEIKPTQWVCFTGRTTHWACGVVNERKVQQEWKKVFGLDTTHEWTVGLENGNKVEFGDKGDSGAWVINEYGQLVGMHTGGMGNSGVVTPILEVFKDIEERTGGWKPKLP